MKKVGLFISLILIVAVIAIITPTFGDTSSEIERPYGIPRLPKGLFLGALGGLAALVLLSITRMITWVLASRHVRILLPFLPSRQTLLLFAIWLSALLLVFFLGAFIVSFLRFDEEDTNRAISERGDGVAEISETFAEEVPLEAEPESLSSDSTGWNRRILLYSFFAVAAIGICIWSVRLYRSAPSIRADERDVDVESLRRDLKSASRLSLAKILEVGDNRTAVLAAYALMYDCFLKLGYHRSPSQTPYEFMADAVRSLKKSWPRLPDLQLLRLTEVYEVAKFSDHPILDDQRRSAAACLSEIEDSM